MGEQQWNPDQYRRDAAFVARLGEPLLEQLSVKAGGRVLDLGCGDGTLTVKLLERGFSVVGVDSSAEQVQAARALGIDARVMDGEALTFENEFDAVFSNATLHWLKRPERVVAGVARALMAGGQFVAECGGAGNVARIEGALVRGLERRGIAGRELSPWLFATPEQYREPLEAHGFRVERMELFERPTPLPGDVTAWIELFGQSFLKALPEQDRAEFLQDMRSELAPALQKPDGSWVADYVRLRFVARKLAR